MIIKTTKKTSTKKSEYTLTESDLQINGYDPFRDADGYEFNEAEARRVIDWVEKYCTHVEGELAGQPYILPPWQRAIVANLWGWRRPDGSRRYRECLTYVPRKNSKTTLLAALGLVGLMADSEAGAQVYSVAADQAQAALCHKIMSAMIGNKKILSDKLVVHRSFKSIEYRKTNSIYRALSSEAGTKHGLNPSLVISDEIHAMPDRELLDAMKTGMGARRSPLLVHISTADYWRPESPCNILLSYAKSVKDGVNPDPTFLPALWFTDKDADWEDPEVWKAVNPNYGLSVKPDFLKEQATRAKNEPSYLNEFLRLHLNITTDAKTVWLPLHKWDACVKQYDLQLLNGRACFGGLDLSATTDLSAFALYFPDTGHLLVWYWMPEDRAREKEKKDRVPYLTWAAQGLITLTTGDVVDYQFIRHKIKQLAKQYNIKNIAYDPWNATGLIQQMTEEDRLPCIEFRQGFMSMNAPSKQLETLIMSNKIHLPQNAVLRWNISNCMVDTDPAGNIKPSKSSSTGRIDGIIASIMSIGLAGQNHTRGSVYETRGALLF